jgi:uncharacterized protein
MATPSMSSQTGSEAQERPPRTRTLIDTDVHEGLRSKEELLPYLERRWHRHITNTGGIFPGATIPSSFPYVVPTPAPGRMDWMLPDGSMGTDLDTLRTHLFDGEQVTTAILNGFFYPSVLVGNFEFAAALAAAYNDWQIEHWLEKDARLRGSIQVVAEDAHVAAREIDRVAAHPQVVQVFLPLVRDRQYGDPRYRPIFEAAVRHDLAVSFHHGQHTETLLGFPRNWIEWHSFAAPQCSMNQCMSLIFNGLFDKYPELKVVFLESGVAWMPWFMWRLDQQYREARVDVPWVKRLPSDHMRDCVRIATQPMGDIQTKDFVKLVEMVDSDRIFVFSTDYPHYDADSVANTLPDSMPATLRDRIRYENALDTYRRLDPETA